ncbi:K domain type 1 [Trinorchestia longiramus]|nr:K domain type 1 [Trinorchestia longiramus]
MDDTVSSPTDTLGLSLTPTGSAGPHVNAAAPLPPPPLQEKPAPTYDQLFPALKSSGDGLCSFKTASAPSTMTTAQSGGWIAAARNNDAMRIQSSTVTQVFDVRHEERAKIDGNNQFGESASSSICADITKRTGAHIEISSAKDQRLTFLVTGKSDAVAKARKLVLEKFQAQMRQTIQIPKEHHKFLLGKKGKRLQELELSTSTKIQVPPANDPSDVVTVIGTKECIDKALHEIRVISDQQSKQAYEVVEVPKIYHPFVCGANNSTVADMMAEYGVRINVPPVNDLKDEITITGEKENVLKCKEIITKTWQDMEQKCQTVSVEVPKHQHKHVVGTKGCNIAEILQLFNVSVDVPPQISNSASITLRGPQDKLGSALTMVYDKANSVVQKDITAPTWLHRHIIGRKGANINKITEEFSQVHVEFTEESELIKLEGPMEDVHKAGEKLNCMIKELMSRLTQDQIIVDPKFHKHIIGKSGTNINRIRNETNVIINIEPNGNVIRLEGTPEAVAQGKQELLELVKKMENEKERDINIEHRLHRSIIGSKGEKIREIRDKFNQVQISLPDPGQKSDTVKIRGPKEDVDACYKHLQTLVKELLEDNYQIKVPIFKQFLKFIIGKSGANINKIRAETNTRIELSSNDQGSDEILIIGRKENCEKAKERIHEIQEELANIVEVDIIVPAKFHNSIIGQRGRLIRSISEECGGVAIKFPPADKKSDKVTIRGPKEDVQKAKKALVELSNERQQSSFTAEVRCKLQHHKFLIGKNGATIRKMRETTGARIIFPTDKDDDKEIISIIGKKDQVAAAQKALEETIRQLDNIVETQVTVPQKYYLHFIQRRFEVLRQIEYEFGGVSVSFPRNGQNSDQVTIKGGVECVAGAKERILEIVKELESQVNVDVVIPQRHHRTVMGPRGSKVQGIQAQHGVEIKFPERATPEEMQRREEEGPTDETRPCDIVMLKGSAEACEAAKKALLDLVPVTEEVLVPFKFHRFIIGQRGQSVRALMSEHDVNIQIPPASAETDVIKVVGMASNVQDAKASLLKKVEELEAEEEDKAARSYQLTINVQPDYHSKIIGKKGSVVSKIRDKFGVNIQFPSKNEEDPSLITITGYEKSCESARQAIIDITGDLDSFVKVSVEIDQRVHARLIGYRGKAIRKIMDEHKVSITFPRDETTPDTVVISGAEANVEKCQEELLNLAEEYMQDIQEREDINQFSSNKPPPLELGACIDQRLRSADAETRQKFADDAEQEQAEGNWAAEAEVQETTRKPLANKSKPAQNGGTHLTNGSAGPKKQGFVVAGAPWAQEAPNMNSSQDFPSMGKKATAAIPQMSAWGPKR